MAPLVPVKSSQLAAVGYDVASQTLAIRFNGGQKTYHYRDVPPEVHQGLVKADSIGKFFGSNVRGKFDFTAVDGEPADGQAATA